MTRTEAIKVIKAHAAAGDLRACTRVFIENRISHAVYDQAVADGQALGKFVAERDAKLKG